MSSDAASVKIRADYNDSKTKVVLTITSLGVSLTPELLAEALHNYAYLLDEPGPLNDTEIN